MNKRQPFDPMKGAWLGRVVTGGVCAGLFALLTVSVLNTPWVLSTEVAAGDMAIVEIGKHFFTDYLLPFELASVLLLIALIGGHCAGSAGVYSRCCPWRTRISSSAAAGTPQGTGTLWFWARFQLPLVGAVPQPLGGASLGRHDYPKSSSKPGAFSKVKLHFWTWARFRLVIVVLPPPDCLHHF